MNSVDPELSRARAELRELSAELHTVLRQAWKLAERVDAVQVFLGGDPDSEAFEERIKHAPADVRRLIETVGHLHGAATSTDLEYAMVRPAAAIRQLREGSELALDVLSENMHGDGTFTFRLNPDAHLALAKLNGTGRS